MWRPGGFFLACFFFVGKMVPKSQEKRKIEEGMKEEVERMRPFCWELELCFGSTFAPCVFGVFRQVMEDERSRARQVIDDGEYTVRRQVQKERLGQKLFVIHKFVHQICC